MAHETEKVVNEAIRLSGDMALDLLRHLETTMKDVGMEKPKRGS